MSRTDLRKIDKLAWLHIEDRQVLAHLQAIGMID